MNICHIKEKINLNRKDNTNPDTQTKYFQETKEHLLSVILQGNTHFFRFTRILQMERRHRTSIPWKIPSISIFLQKSCDSHKNNDDSDFKKNLTIIINIHIIIIRK